jgi:hypothetical protein
MDDLAARRGQLFIAQRLDRVEPRGFACRIEPKKYSYGGAK